MTLAIALYSALLSTVLGVIAIINFIKDRKLISVEERFSFSEGGALYAFVISNISGRPFTIFDCTFMSLARAGGGQLEETWGVHPRVAKDLFAEASAPIELPLTLTPGQIVIVTIDSKTIIDQFALLERIKLPEPRSEPTEVMKLEIAHSMSKKPHTTRFELSGDELKQGRSGKTK